MRLIQYLDAHGREQVGVTAGRAEPMQAPAGFVIGGVKLR